MKDSYKVIDMDTHVNPSLDVLEKYVDPAFRPRLRGAATVLQCAATVTARWDHTDLEDHYRGTYSLRSVSGRSAGGSTPEPCPARARP